MADITVPAKTDLPAVAAALAPAAPAAPTGPAAVPGATKKKSAYRPQKTPSAVAEQILEAVAATKERQAPTTLATMKKTISASGYEMEKSGGARPVQSVKTLINKGSLVQGGGGSNGGPGSLQISKPQEAEGEPKKKRRGRKPAPKRTTTAATEAKPHKSIKRPKAAKKSAAKSPQKGRTAKAKKAPKRPAAPRAVGRKRQAPKRR